MGCYRIERHEAFICKEALHMTDTLDETRDQPGGDPEGAATRWHRVDPVDVPDEGRVRQPLRADQDPADRVDL